MDFLLSHADTVASRTTDYLKMRKTNPEALTALLALNCVKRGKYWLNQHAPRGWWRNCVNGARSRINTGWSGKDVVSFAFEYDARFAYNGYVLSELVFHHFKLSYPQTMRLGFGVFWRPFRKYPEVSITASMLDAAWSDLVTNPTGDMRAKYRHPTDRDRRLARMDFSLKEPSRFERLWNRLRLAFTA